MAYRSDSIIILIVFDPECTFPSKNPSSDPLFLLKKSRKSFQPKSLPKFFTQLNPFLEKFVYGL